MVLNHWKYSEGSPQQLNSQRAARHVVHALKVFFASPITLLHFAFECKASTYIYLIIVAEQWIAYCYKRCFISR